MSDKLFSNKFIFLFLFIVSWLIELELTISENRTYLLIPRMTNLIFLGLYYKASVKKIKTTVILFLIALMLTGAFFSFNDYGTYAMLFFISSRAILIKLLVSYKEKLNRKTFLSVMGLFVFSIGLILYVLYKNTLFYYLSALATILLIVLLSISFTRLLTLGRKQGNLELFIAISIFLIADALFGSQKINGTNLTYIILSATFYYVAYFLIIQFVIKKESGKAN